MKTSNLLKTSLGILISTIFIVTIMEVIAKKQLKECESRQSFGCPRFTCPYKNSTCGYKPWICPPHETSCSGHEQCIGFCGSGDSNCLD